MKQNPTERIADYVKRVAKESSNYGISNKEVFEVAIAGMKEGREDIRRQLIGERTINQALYLIIEKMEDRYDAEERQEKEEKTRVENLRNKQLKEVSDLLKEPNLQINKPVSKCTFCLRSGHMEKFCRAKNQGNRNINEVIETTAEKLDNILNKESSI